MAHVPTVEHYEITRIVLYLRLEIINDKACLLVKKITIDF